jgi:hypothetical protein
MMLSSCRSVLITVILCGAAAAARAQTPLPTGTPQKATVESNTPAEFTLAAKTAGVVVVAVQGDGDLALQVTDEDGQALPDGSADRDLNGSEGTEMLSMIIPEPGSYRVRVRLQGSGSASFQIAGSWTPFPPFAQASTDPDRRPSQARSAAVGKPIEDGLNSKTGDNWDWFVMKIAQAGTLVVLTRRVGEGDTDLVLEAFTGGNFAQAVQRSDQDLQGNNANESVTLNVEAGQLVHIKVASTFSGANTRYRLSSSLVP